MNDRKSTITFLAWCCIILSTAPSASADFVGVTTANKDDPDIDLLCTQGTGPNIPCPLTVCNVSAVFDNPDDLLLAVANADLQVFNGAVPDVFFQHPLNFSGSPSPACAQIPAFPDVICDTFITIGYKCGPEFPPDETTSDVSFDPREFNNNGHVVGYWFNADPSNGQGDAGTWPDLQVLFLQSSVAVGLSLSGVIDVFWRNAAGDTIQEVGIPLECAAMCIPGAPCSDGDPCTENDMCGEDGCVHGTPIDCDDGNSCTDDFCDKGQCMHVPLPDGTSCDDGDACTYDDYCDYGVCYGYPQWCTDNNDCTIDYCDPASGCVNEPIDCDDGNPCTDDSCDSDSGQCVNVPNNDLCDDGDACTNDACDPDMGCTHADVECPEGQGCESASGECVQDQDPCECVNGRVTLCHIPQGNRANAHTIIVGCAARDKHLAHGDFCGPCE